MGWGERKRLLPSRPGCAPSWHRRGEMMGSEDGRRLPGREALTVVGKGLGRAEFLSPKRAEMRSPERGPQSSKMKTVRFSLDPLGARKGAEREPAARAYSATGKVQLIQVGPAGAGVRCDPRSCWAAPRPKEHKIEKLRKPSARGRHFRVAQDPSTTSAAASAVDLCESHGDLGDELLDSQSKFAKDSGSSTAPSVSLINIIFKPQMLTKSETTFKEKTMMELRKVNSRIKQTRMQQESVMQETEQLYNEKLLVQTENQFFLEYLDKEVEEYRRKPEELWEHYLQKSEEIEQRRQESASRYAKQTSVFKGELLQKENLQSNLKQQLQALRDVSLVKEKQEREIQMLQEEKKEAQAEINAKKLELQLQMVQEKALLEKQLSEPDPRQLGKRKREELERKAQALEAGAKQYTFEFYHDMRRENQQLKKELQQQTQQCQELEAIRSWLKNQKRQLQQEQWYMDCLVRGRNRLQGRHNPCPGQGAPKTTITPLLITKSNINPKQFPKQH
ncbi:coiled-coil domain-containing protein 121 [Leopardus geoffroyi]|uniref:coiled-coil domain-containing protein 121 n=1 Tax=Leopardus geoffroyi TaxID=46844 RepID=UPI001E26477F|nr:coiled-coil domain-containing protein 121 [Leopardus geoffroyi]